MLVGTGLLVLFVMFVFSGQFVPRRLGGMIVPISMIGMGWAWIKGETYGE